jgi:hypothetical protein
MARVYRVTDQVTGREAALKQLLAPEQAEQAAAVTALFEREFHTLAQLSHPRVIAVYDYAVEPGIGPYYTMDLLDGGDLRDRAPLPWREVCRPRRPPRPYFRHCESSAHKPSSSGDIVLAMSVTPPATVVARVSSAPLDTSARTPVRDRGLHANHARDTSRVESGMPGRPRADDSACHEWT